MRDNDSNYHPDFDRVLQSAGIAIKRNTPRPPNLLAHVERLIQTLKHGCLDKFVIVANRVQHGVGVAELRDNLLWAVPLASLRGHRVSFLRGSGLTRLSYHLHTTWIR